MDGSPSVLRQKSLFLPRAFWGFWQATDLQLAHAQFTPRAGLGRCCACAAFGPQTSLCTHNTVSMTAGLLGGGGSVHKNWCSWDRWHEPASLQMGLRWWNSGTADTQALLFPEEPLSSVELISLSWDLSLWQEWSECSDLDLSLSAPQPILFLSFRQDSPLPPPHVTQCTLRLQLYPVCLFWKPYTPPTRTRLWLLVQDINSN